MGHSFIENTLRRRCSPVNLLHIFRTLFPKNSSGWVLLYVDNSVCKEIPETHALKISWLPIRLSELWFYYTHRAVTYQENHLPIRLCLKLMKRKER